MNEGSSKKGLIWAVVAVLVVAVGAFLFFAAQNGDEEEDTTETTTSEQTTDDEFAAQDSIVDIVTGNPDFSTLAAAVTEAGLVDTLSGEGPFTVFAPTNDAFEVLLAELDITAEELLADENLVNILTYHVVEGSVFASDVVALNGEKVVTVNGQTVTITVDEEGNVFVNNAQVTATDIQASNGVVHVINAVLLPEAE